MSSSFVEFLRAPFAWHFLQGVARAREFLELSWRNFGNNFALYYFRIMSSIMSFRRLHSKPLTEGSVFSLLCKKLLEYSKTR